MSPSCLAFMFGYIIWHKSQHVDFCDNTPEHSCKIYVITHNTDINISIFTHTKKFSINKAQYVN